MGVIIFSLGPVLNLPNVVIEFGRIFDLMFGGTGFEKEWILLKIIFF